jgi:hypothetical protein
MLFNFEYPITPRDNSEALGAPFNREEIDTIVKQLPSNSSRSRWFQWPIYKQMLEHHKE